MISNPMRLHFFILFLIGISSTFLSLTCTFANVLKFEQAYENLLNYACQLKAVEVDIAAKKAERWQAGMRINPALAVELNEIGASDCKNDINELFVGISQIVELGGKRSARIKVANAVAESATWNLEILKCELYGELLHAFIDVAIAQERVELAKKQHALLEQASECFGTKKEEGKASLIQTKRAEVACRTSKLEVSKRQMALSNAYKELRALWDTHPPVFDEVTFPIYEILTLPSYEELTSALEGNPEMRKAETEVTKASKIIRLEKSLRVPDLAVQLGVSTDRFTKDPVLSIGFSMPIPIFDCNQGNICRALYEYEEALFNRMILLNQLEAKLSVIYASWQSAYEQVKEIKNLIIPHAHESYELAEQSYQEGNLEYIDFLDARRILFNVQEQYLDSIEEYHHQRADALTLAAQCCR